ncbi:MAG: hypothetical protein ACKVW3_08690 [Phycisphaerales bacterium]
MSTARVKERSGRRTLPVILRVADLSPPAWVHEAMGLGDEHWPGERSWARREGAGWTLISATIAGARTLAALELQRRVCEVYADLGAELSRGRPLYPVRFWNFVPDIHGEMGGDLDRYMIFNAGRFAGFAGWHADRADFGPRLSTASGVGHDGADLVVHCLAGATPGTPVENPRQVPAYRYSKRLGPLPPCFARATVLDRAPGAAATVLVGGTAAVRGEDSTHEGDLAGQLDETLENMAALAAEAAGTSGERSSGLGLYRELRAYVTRPEDDEAVVAAIERSFAGVRRVEVMRASICRRELLVEIEGVARTPEGAGDAV